VQRAANVVSAFRIIGTGNESTVHSDATSNIVLRLVVVRVYDETDLMHYMAAMNIIRQWLNGGMITAADYAQIDTIVAEKFGIPSRSIWRENNLIIFDTNGNMPPTKGGIIVGTHC